MANEFKVRKGLIINGSGSTILDVRGSLGQLFSVTDSLSGSLFGVSDISGVPIFEVFSDETIRLGTSGSEAILISGSHATVSGSFSGSFVGDGSGITGLAQGGSVTAINNATANELVTIGATTTELDAEANLTFDGTQLEVTGNITASGHIKTGQYIYFGADTSLFRDGTNILRTDDAFHANANIHVGGDGKIFDRAGTNSFIHFDHSNSKIRIQEGGEEMVTIDSGTVTINQAQGQNKFKVFASSSSAHFFVSSSGMTIINNDTTDYFGAATRVQIAGGSASQNVGIRSNTLYLYSYSNGSNSQLVFGDGGANWGLIANDSTFRLYDYSISGLGLTVSAGSNLFAFNSGSKNVYIGQNLAETAAEGKLKIYNRSNDGIISTYQYNSTLELRSGISGSSYVDNWSRILLKDNNSGAGNIAFWVSGSEKMRIINDGNVGISTTVPKSILQIGSATFTGVHATYADNRAGFSLNGSLKSMLYTSTYNDANFPDYGMVFVHGPSTSNYNIWSISPDGPAKGSNLNFIYQSGSGTGNIHTQTPKVVLKGSTGHVGIGVTDPGQRLHVGAGHILLDNNYEIRQKDSGGTQRTVFELDSSNDLNIGGSYAGALKFIGGGSYTEVMRIHDNGLVGIGTTSPSRTLHIQGKDSNEILLAEDTGSSLGTKLGRFKHTDGTNNPYLDISSDSQGILVNTGFSTGISGSFTLQSNGGSSYMVFNTAGANERMRIDSSGNVTLTEKLYVTGSGSVSAPAYSFAGFTDTGMYRSLYSGTSDQVNIATDGTNRAAFNSAGITSAANVYTGTSGQFRNYAGVWKATTGTSGNGFNFSSADLTDAVTISADANNQLTVSGSGANTGIVIVGGSNAMTTRLRAANNSFHIDVDQGQQGGRTFSLNLSGSNKINVASSRTLHYNIFTQRGNLDGAPPAIQFDRNDTSIVAGNNLGSIKVRGKDPSSFNEGAGILFEGDGNWDTDDYPTRILFKTDQAGTLTTALTIDSNQSSSFTGNVTVTGDLTVTGTTTTVNQTNLDVSDNIIGLNRGASSNANDSGIIIERGSTGDNATILWDESIDTFVIGVTTATASDTGNIALSGFSPIKTAGITAGGNITVSSNSYVISSRKFTARDSNGVMLTADDAASGLAITDTGKASFTSEVTASGDILVTGSSNPTVEVEEASGANLKMRAGSVGRIGTYNNKELRLVQNSVDKVTVNTSGNVEISGSAQVNKGTVFLRGTTSAIENIGGNYGVRDGNGNYGGSDDSSAYTTPQDFFHIPGTLRVGPKYNTTDRDHIRLVPAGTTSTIQMPNENAIIHNNAGNIVLKVGASTNALVVDSSANITASGAIIPTGSAAKDLGKSSNRWATVYASSINSSGQISSSRITITDSAVPFHFIESGNTGTGKFWRQVLDGGDIRFDVDTTSTNGDGSFSSYIAALQLNADGHTDINGALDVGGNAVFAGSITIPEYINHTSDGNTNFGFGGADDFRVTVGGSKRLNVTTAGVEISGSLTGVEDLSILDNKKLKFGAAHDFEILHNSSTNVNHISSLLDRQLSLNANIIRFTNQANSVTAASISGSKVGIGVLSPTASLHVSGTTNVAKIEGSGSTIFSVDGSQGQLFSVTDQLSGSLFNVSDISGVPILQVSSDDKVSMGTFAANTLVVTGSVVGIGTASPDSLLEISSDSTTDFLKLTSEGSSANPIKLIFEKSSTEQGIIEYNRNGDLEIYNSDGDGGVMIDGSTSAGGDLYVANSGKVGIGTTEPSEKLEVAGKAIIRKSGTATAHSDTDLLVTDATAGSSTAAIQILGGASGHSNLHFSDTDSYNRGGILYDHSTDTMTIKTAASTAMAISSEGSASLGTTSKLATLTIQNNSSVTSSNTNEYTDFQLALRNNQNATSSFAGIAFDVSNEVDADSIGAAIKALNVSPSSNNHTAHLTFHVNSAGDDSLTERMRITNSGQVGIGTTTTFEKFCVNGGNIGVAGRIRFGAERNAFNIYSNKGSGQLHALTSKTAYGQTGQSNGTVALSQETSTTATGILLKNTSTGNTNTLFSIFRNNNTGTTNAFTSGVGSPTTLLKMTGQADMTVGYSTSFSAVRAENFYSYGGGTTYYLKLNSNSTSLNARGDVIAFASSDERMKEDIRPIENPLSKLDNIKGVKFKWNNIHEDFKGKEDIGVIAQDVEKVLPEIVTTRDNGYKAVDYQKLSVLLIESVKELKKEVEELKSKINK